MPMPIWAGWPSCPKPHFWNKRFLDGEGQGHLQACKLCHALLCFVMLCKALEMVQNEVLTMQHLRYQSLGRGVRSDAQLSPTETRFQKCSQSGKNGSRHPMLSTGFFF